MRKPEFRVMIREEIKKLKEGLSREEAWEIADGLIAEIGESLGDWPRQSFKLMQVIQKGAKIIKFPMYFVEEVKDGRGAQFNERWPLKIKNKILEVNNQKFKVTDIKFKDTDNQESDSDSEYINYNYMVTIKKI